jgi:hypothetical protein
MSRSLRPASQEITAFCALADRAAKPQARLAQIKSQNVCGTAAELQVEIFFIWK